MYGLLLFAIATLTGMGVGSGGLLLLYLTAVAGTDQLRAQGINLFFFLFSAVGSLFLHVRRRKIDRRVLLTLCLSGMVGAAAGVMLSHVVPTVWIRRVFGTVMILSGIGVFFSCVRHKP